MAELVAGSKGLSSAGKLGKVDAPCVNSFDGDTQVLRADGTTKPIKDIVVGDQVQASDPETGREGPREVTATWPHMDTMYVLVLADGTTIDTTEDHPFWNATDQQWQRADDLDFGDQLATNDGRAFTVHGITPDSAHQGHAYNLTVDDLHTYYVVAGDTSVLVHNCGGAVPSHPSTCACADGGVPQVRNRALAGGVHPKTGIPFDKNGFPDFSSIRHPNVPDVQIALSGSRSTDFA